MDNNNSNEDDFSVGTAPSANVGSSDSGDDFSVGSAPTSKSSEAAPSSPATSQPTDNTDYANMGWGEVALNAAKAAPKSALNVAENIGSSVIHPIKTLETLGDLGSGLASKGEGYLGVQQDPAEKAKTEALVDAIGEHYKDVYGGLGSGDTSGLKKELSTDPMGPLMDAATVLTGGEGALAKAPGMLGKAGELAGRLGSAIDPVQNAVRVAGTVAKPITWAGSKVIPAMQSVTTGVERPYLKMAAAAGASDDPVVQGAFMDAVKGKSDPLDIVNAVNGAVAKKRALASAKFDKDASAIGLKGDGTGAPNLDWSGVNKTLEDQRNRLVTKDPDQVSVDPATGEVKTIPGASLPTDEGAVKALDAIQTKVRELQNTPENSIFQKMPGFNALKKNISNMKYGPDGSIKNISPETNSVLSSVGNSVKQAILDQHPEYADLMEDWGNSADDIKNAQKAFGRGDKLSGMQQLNKIMIQSRKADGQSMLSDLAQYDPRIPYMIAGHTMSDWLPNRLRTAIESPFAVLAALHNPSLLPGFAATSPRLAGNLNYLAGKASKIPKKITLKKGLALEQGAKNLQQPQQQANGGRIERKDGGSVIDPEKEAERLIGEVGKIRKQHSAKTRPLLDVPDEAITKALAVANMHI